MESANEMCASKIGSDQCRYTVHIHGRDGKPKRVQKPTRIIRNVLVIRHAFRHRCDGGHSKLLNGQRKRCAQVSIAQPMLTESQF